MIIYIHNYIIVIFAENASFTCKLRRHLLALMALTTPISHKIRIPTQRGHDITIRDFNYIILQKRFVQKLQHIRPLLRAHILI